MSFKTFSYMKKNRFDYPVWQVFVTFMFGSNPKRTLKDDPKVRYIALPLYLLTIVIGYKSYYTWDDTKDLTWERIKKITGTSV